MVSTIPNNSIKHQSFVYTQLNDQTVQFLTISSSISNYLPTPPLGQDMTQGQFLSGV